MVSLLDYHMPKENLRIILMGKDIELRIISLIVRSQEISENVVYFDLGSSDSTVSLAKDFGCQILEYNSNHLLQNYLNLLRIHLMTIFHH